MSGDWSRLLASPDYLGDLYDCTPPSADSCDPFYVHIDERENSVTVGFDTRILPVNVPKEWHERGFNAFEFCLVFEGIEGLRVTGWDSTAAERIDMTVSPEAFEVILGVPGSGIMFRASTARLARARAYLASDSI
ncbi:Imm50 family immunity protein [Streptomyces sp. NPDC005244]|uniref:Imm50 family immunity protein n=1 Tax=Streptomyces sp. NPDC005244 TaxID=3364708 RepID=UPI0036904AC1